jgi:hypothetical protein
MKKLLSIILLISLFLLLCGCAVQFIECDFHSIDPLVMYFDLIYLLILFFNIFIIITLRSEFKILTNVLFTYYYLSIKECNIWLFVTYLRNLARIPATY